MDRAVRRSPSRHPVAGAVAAVASAGAVLAGGALWASAEAMFRCTLDTRFRGSIPARKRRGALRDSPAPDGGGDPQAAEWFRATRQPVSVVSRDGLTLRGWLFDPDRSVPRSHLVAICCHGYTGGPEEMAPYAHRYARMGFTVLVPALRAHPPSEGRFIGMGRLDGLDLLDWIGLVVSADSRARILLHGNSMGAAAVMMAAGDPSLPRNVVAAVEDSGYDSARDEFLRLAQRLYRLPRPVAVPLVGCLGEVCRRRAGYTLREASCVEALRHTTLPFLLIHGADDELVDPSCLERLAQACAGVDVERLLVPGAGHTGAAAADPGRYWRRVGGFVARLFDLPEAMPPVR